MKVSVVMSTYNGAAYLRDQLESLKRQTRQPDEVIILDDCSTDDTEQLIRKFIEKNHLDNWVFERNIHNQGWQMNFVNGIIKSTGEIIFTCDQDDIWIENKIERMLSILEKNPEILLLAGDYKILEEDTAGKIEKKRFDEKFFYVQRPGCVFAFRRELWEIARKYTFKNNPHDALLWRTAITLGRLYLFHSPVIFWRRHKKAQTNGVRPSREKMLEWFIYVKNVVKSLQHLLDENNVDEKDKKKKLINCFEKVIEKRQLAYQKKNPFFQIQTWRYYRYYPTNKSVLGETLRITKMMIK